MKHTLILTISALILSFQSLGQAQLINVKTKTYKTSSGIKVEGQEGYLEVPENRNNPASRKIKTKFVHLKSLSDSPATPVIYLEGGGGQSTWEADSPDDLNDRLEILEVSDLIYLDRRGSSDRALTYIWRDGFPEEFFVSEEKANEHYQKLIKEALVKFEEKEIDVTGYNIEEHANDVNDLMDALMIDQYTIFGFSYGSHIGMTVMNLFPERVERAILVGPDAPNQALNFPSHLDAHILKVGTLIEQDSTLDMTAEDFSRLVTQTMEKLEANPVTIKVKNPLNGKKIDVPIGAFGLGLVLRLDIDDAYDVPVIPRLLHTINEGDYSMLTWFVQKRVVFALGLPGQGINQQLASGVSPERWSRIKKEAQESIFGNVVNFPFSAAKDHWVESTLSFDSTVPTSSDIPTLFITGTLDCRTPEQQTEAIMKGFSNASHIQVENAGHEQAQWDAEVANDFIPAFITGDEIESRTVFYKKIEFVNLTGEASGHQSLE